MKVIFREINCWLYILKLTLLALVSLGVSPTYSQPSVHARCTAFGGSDQCQISTAWFSDINSKSFATGDAACISSAGPAYGVSQFNAKFHSNYGGDSIYGNGCEFDEYYWDGVSFSRYAGRIFRSNWVIGLQQCPQGGPSFEFYLDPADNSVRGEGRLWCAYRIPDEDRSCSINNPTTPGLCDKIHRETDYSGAGASALEFARNYHSRWPLGSGASFGGLVSTRLGTEQNAGWSHTYYRSIEIDRRHPKDRAAVTRGDGSVAVFFAPKVTSGARTWAGATGNQDQLTEQFDSATQTVTGWTYRVAADDTVETFDGAGRLLSIRARNGWLTTLGYSTATTAAAIAPRAGLLISVKNPFGRELRLTYDAVGRIKELLPPGAVSGLGSGNASSPIRYAYEEAASLGASTAPAGQLTSVTWQDGSVRRYHYEDARYPGALTGITDETGVRFATYGYDGAGRITHTEHVGGTDRADFNYADFTSGANSTSNTVTTYDASGSPTQSIYTFVDIGGVRYPSSVSAPCQGCGNTQQSTSYDAAGNTTKTIAHDGSVTFYAYDAKGRETERAVFPSSYQGATTRPALSAATSVTSTKWHATWQLPLQVAEPGKLSSYTYDSKGNLTGQSWSATSDSTGRLKFSATKTGSTYATGWGYNVNSLVTSIVEKTDATETGRWTLGYNALGDVTSVSDVKEAQSVALTVNAAGLATQLVASNGAQAQFTWTPRGLLSTASMPGYTMGVTWDARALPLQYQFSPGPKVVVTYDALGQPLTVQNGTAPPQTVVWADPEASSTQRYAGVFSGAGPKDRTASLLGPRLEELVLALGRAAQRLELPMSSAQAQVPPAPAFSPGVAYGLSRFIFPNYWAFGPAASNGQFDPDKPSCCGGSSGGPSSSFQSQLPPSFLLTALLIQSTASSVAQTISDEILIFKSARKLRANLCNAGVNKPQVGCYHAHHIVAVAHPRADPARRILASTAINIDLNDAANGMWVDCYRHQGLHTYAYYDEVNRLLAGAKTKSDALAILALIRLLISSGNFP